MRRTSERLNTNYVIFSTEDAWQIQKAVYRTGDSYSKCNVWYSVWHHTVYIYFERNKHWYVFTALGNTTLCFSVYEVKQTDVFSFQNSRCFRWSLVTCAAITQITKHACTGTRTPPQRITLIRFENVFRIPRWTIRPTGTPSRRWRLQRSPSLLCYWKVRLLFCHIITHASERRALWSISIRQVWHVETNRHFTSNTCWWKLTKDFPFLDITFIHEGNKTFHDNLVNFEKLVSSQTLHSTSCSCKENIRQCWICNV